jgi:hypothetical protein
LADYALSPPERRFLEELNRLGVHYLVVGVGAAVLQGATTATQDVDLWFESYDGESLGDRFDVVVHMHGLREFAAEYEASKELAVDGVPVRVLPLDRIIESKRALGRARDLAQIPALEEALAALNDAKTPTKP